MVIGELFFGKSAGDGQFFFLGPRQFEHRIVQHGLHDAAKSPCTEFEFYGFLDHVVQSGGIKFERDAVHFEQLDILLAQGVFGFGQDLPEGRRIEGIEVGKYRESTDEFRNQPKAL